MFFKNVYAQLTLQHSTDESKVPLDWWEKANVDVEPLSSPMGRMRDRATEVARSVGVLTIRPSCPVQSGTVAGGNGLEAE